MEYCTEQTIQEWYLAVNSKIMKSVKKLTIKSNNHTAHLHIYDDSFSHLLKLYAVSFHGILELHQSKCQLNIWRCAIPEESLQLPCEPNSESHIGEDVCDLNPLRKVSIQYKLILLEHDSLENLRSSNRRLHILKLVLWIVPIRSQCRDYKNNLIWL